MENYRCFEPALLGTVAIRVKLAIVHMGAMVDQQPMTNEIGKSLIDRLETNKQKKKKRNYLEKRAFTLALECIVDVFVIFSSASSRRPKAERG